MKKNKALNTSLWSIGVNFCLAIIKVFVGYFGNSYALIADAIESTSDIFSSFFVYLGLKIATKPADQNHPYGHGKAEPLTTFVVCGFLIVSAVIISIQSINHIITPHKTPAPYTLYVLIGVILIKEITFIFLCESEEYLKQRFRDSHYLPLPCSLEELNEQISLTK